MKQLLFQLFMMLCIAHVFAQPATVPLGLGANDKFSQNFKTNWSDQVSVTDVNGRPITNKYPDVNGTPFFDENYKYAIITLVRGRVISKVKTRIDLVSNETHFISVNGVEAFLERGTVREISYDDTTEAGIIHYTFKTGFPSFDKQTPDNFYLVLAEGRSGMLKSISKKVTTRKNDLSNETIKEFETYEDYFFYVKGEMKRWKKDKDFVLAEMTDKKVEVDQFITTNKTNFRNAESVAKL
ncbi:MAG: hypothetical protein JWQ30_815, partial [Sediminibacterium sp.]|nr:hypothetical protein [Sediminibacterium sp.]